MSIVLYIILAPVILIMFICIAVLYSVAAVVTLLLFPFDYVHTLISRSKSK